MVTFELTQKTALSVAFDVTIRGGGGGEPYTGEYDVTPKVSTSVVLQTEGKTMKKKCDGLKNPPIRGIQSRGRENFDHRR